MSNYTLIILLQSILIFIWVIIVKMRNNKTPAFDNWLINKLHSNPSVHFEEAFNEYISEYRMSFRKRLPDSTPKASLKLKLIEEYNIDDVLGNDESYLNYKRSLSRSA